VLTEDGLAAAVEAVADRFPFPVRTDVGALEQVTLPEDVSAAAYFVVCEALTNTAKYADARSAAVTGRVAHDRLRLTVCDDGHGGATLHPGHGLAGLVDRVEGLGGSLRLRSDRTGTEIGVELPCG
jgi:signal transduction histidine kinase